MKTLKFWTAQLKDGKSTCPWCNQQNDHITKICEHVHKVTATGKVFYFWGIRPIPATA